MILRYFIGVSWASRGWGAHSNGPATPQPLLLFDGKLEIEKVGIFLRAATVFTFLPHENMIDFDVSLGFVSCEFSHKSTHVAQIN